MWEEPREERLWQLRDRRASAMPSLVAAACLVALALAAMFANDIAAVWSARGRPAAASKWADSVVRRPQGEAAVPAHAGRSSPQPSAARGTSATEWPTPPRSSGSLATLAQLEKTCTYWRTQNTDGRNSARTRQACQRAADYASKYFLAAAVRSAAPAGRVRPSAIPDSTQSVTPIDCRRKGYGTIEYRECRGREKRQLEAWCRELRNQTERSSGPGRPALLLRTREACHLADNYRIVD